MRTSRCVFGSVVVVAALALLANGCSNDRRGGGMAHDYALTGSWTIDAAPASTSTCAAADIARVQLTIRTQPTNVVVFQNSSACANGSVAAGYVLDPGDFTAEWAAIDSGGATVSMSSGEAFSTIVLAAGSSVTLGVHDFRSDHDYSLTGSWTVDGLPSSASSCSAAGIARVQLTVRMQPSAVVAFQNSTPCSDGSFNAGYVIDSGDFTSQWTAVDGSGAVVGMSGMEAFSTTPLAPGTNVMLRPQDFVGMGGGFNPTGTDATLSAQWQVNGMAPNATNCAGAGLANISIVFYDSADTSRRTGVEVASASCASGAFASAPTRILRAGSYLTSIQALDGGGTVVGSYDAPSVLVVAPMATLNYMLMVANFTTAPAGESLDVAFTWDTTLGPSMTDTTCAMAGVGTMTYRLMSSTGGVVNSMSGIPCGAGVTFDDALIAPGTYSIYVEGAPIGMPTSRNWAITCTGLDVALNEHAMYNCAIDRVM